MVGAGTISRDDPQLTTRLAEGPNPVRVVLDPSRRLAAGHRVFADGQAETLLICDERHAQAGSESIGLARVVGVPADAGRLDLEALLANLAARGVERVFVEGGGATVSGFLEADLLDRLQIAIAPLVTGGTRGDPVAGAAGHRRMPQARIVYLRWEKTCSSTAICEQAARRRAGTRAIEQRFSG